MFDSSLKNAALVLVLSVALLFHDRLSFDSELALLDDVSGTSVPLSINAGSHVYPYTATAVSLTCLLAVILVIICLGGDLE